MVHLAFDDHYNVNDNFENKGPQLKKLEVSYTVDVNMPNQSQTLFTQ